MIVPIASYALLAMTFTIGKMLLFYVPPIFLIGVRMTVAGIILISMQAFLSGPSRIQKKSDLLMICWISVIHIFIPYVTEFIALQTIAPSCAALMFNFTPFFSAFFSYLYFGELMTRKKWLGFFLGLIGIILFLKPTDLGCYDPHACIAYALMLICVGSSVLGWIYVRKLMNSSGYSPIFINGYAMLLGGLQSLALSWCFEPTACLPWGQMKPFLGMLGAIIFVANILFYNLYGLLLKKYTVTMLSFLGFVTPVFVALYDWVFLGIGVGHEFFIAILFLGFGIYIFYQEELQQGYVAKQR